MGEDLYRQEFLCEFLEEASAVFKGLEHCVHQISLEPPKDGKVYVIGADLGRHHDATVFVVMDVSTRKIVWIERMTETHYALQKKSLAALSFRYNNALVHLDTTGFSAGDPIMEDLQDASVHVEGFQFTHTSKKALVDGLRVAISQRLISVPRVPETEQLVKELQDFEVKLGSDGSVRGYGCPEGEGYYDDCVIALALAVYGLKGDLYAKREEDVSGLYESALEDLASAQRLGF